MHAKLRYLFFNYGLFIILALLALVLRLTTPVSAFLMTLIFLLWIFVPGFSLAKIFRFQLEENALGKIISYLSCGLIFQFVMAFLAMNFGLNISALIIVNFIIIGVLFVLSFILELKRNSEIKPLAVKKWLKEIHPLYWLFLALSFFLLVVVSQVGAHLRGDPIFHLGIIRKIIEGGALTLDKLTYVKGVVDELYAYPVWHILMGEINKLSGTNIFSFWMEMPVALTLLVLTVWCYLFRQLFRKEFFALLALILFIIITFSINGGKAYLFTRLMVPDTFNMLLLAPLSFALGLNFIFAKTASNKEFYLKTIVLGLIFSSLAVVHLIQYVYLMMGWWLSLLLFSITNFRQSDFKELIKKFLLAGIFSLVFVLPFLVLLQIKGGTVSGAINYFSSIMQKDLKYDTFQEFTDYGKIAFVLAPVLLIFVKREKRLWLPIALFMLIPLIYWLEPVKQFFYKYLSVTLVNRLYSNVSWTFVVFAVIIGMFLLAIDLWLSKANKTIKLIVNLVLGISAVTFVLFAFISPRLSEFSEGMLVKKAAIIQNNYVLIIIIMLLLALGLILWQKYQPKLAAFFEFREPQNKLAISLIVLIIALIFVAPYLAQMKKKTIGEFSKNPRFFKPVRDPTDQMINFTLLGGWPTINAIKQNLPAKSVIDSNNGYFLIPLMLDQYVSDYWSEADKEFGLVYEPQSALNMKLECLSHGKIEYLMIVGPKQAQKNYFNQYPQYFQFVFQNQNTLMYKINQDKIRSEGYPTIQFDKTSSCWAGKGN